MVRKDMWLTELLALLSPELLDSTLTLFDILILKNILDQARKTEKPLLTIVWLNLEQLIEGRMALKIRNRVVLFLD